MSSPMTSPWLHSASGRVGALHERRARRCRRLPSAEVVADLDLEPIRAAERLERLDAARERAREQAGRCRRRRAPRRRRRPGPDRVGERPPVVGTAPRLPASAWRTRGTRISSLTMHCSRGARRRDEVAVVRVRELARRRARPATTRRRRPRRRARAATATRGVMAKYSTRFARPRRSVYSTDPAGAGHRRRRRRSPRAPRAACRGLVVLARLELALGQAPVVVGGAVDDEDLGAVGHRRG